MKKWPQASLVYSLLLATAAFTLLIFLSIHNNLQIGNVPAFIGFTLFGVVMVVFGFPAPQVGYVSLDRVVQFSSLLIFGALPAAWICGISSLIWPFLPWGISRGNSTRFMVMRAAHNAGMFVFIMLVVGGLYRYFGGSVPLRHLTPHDVILIVILALFMQLLNDVFVGVIARLQGIDWRKSFGLFSAVVDLAAIPMAVFMALVYNRLETPVFVLFLIVLALIVLIVRNFADTRRALEVKLEELVAVNRVGQAVSSSLVLDELVELIYQESRKLVDFDIFMLALYDEEAREIDVRLHHNPKGRQPKRRRKLSEGIFGWVISNNKPVFIRDWETEGGEFKRITVHVGDTPQTQTLIAVPVTYRDRVLGVISVQSYVADRFDESHLNILVTFAGQVAIAIINARLFEELEGSRNQLEQRVQERTRDLALQRDELHTMMESLRSANREKEELLMRLKQQTSKLERQTTELERQTLEDGLTGLYNRRYLDGRLAFEIKRADRYQRRIALAMADLDRFKQINDSFSHMVGDEVLRVLADILRNNCRSIDMIARYGGEEFLLCFPETGLDDATSVCEKIRQQVETYDWSSIEKNLHVTISFGIAGAPPNVYDVDNLIAAADEKLYQAKREGRNRVCA
ncbi:MAG TPA: diguanylate cyclase [Gammaproteobacteria bacterium]|nr:diguanylate cyclase [Gammaproteobacteria bacterium]